MIYSNTWKALALVLFLTSCTGPGYYLQAISGQWKLSQARQDIQTLKDHPDTNPELVKQLKMAGALLKFAESTLDLPANGSYTSYVELEGDALVWNVVAAEEFSLQPKKWCFIVAGCLPYRGFFNQQKAITYSQKLRNNDLDVHVAPVPAYSTLGKLKDPLLSTMLGGSDIRIAAFLFHELAHQRLYVKGDGAFNENYASFIEETGIRIWLNSSGRQDELQRWQQLRDSGDDFNSLISTVRQKLAELYHSDTSDAGKRESKADILQELVQSYNHLKAEKWENNDYYSDWFSEPLNNARLALYDTYQGGQCAFEGLYTQAQGQMPEFHRLAQAKSKLPKDQLSEWLHQTCTGNASTEKL